MTDVGAALVPVASALLGGVFGAGTTWWAQRGAIALERERRAFQVGAGLRVDRRDAALSYLGQAQLVERLAERLVDGESISNAEKGEAMTSLWRHQAAVEVFCTQQLRDLVYEHCQKLSDAIWNPPSQPPYTYLADLKWQILHQARTDLDLSSPER